MLNEWHEIFFKMNALFVLSRLYFELMKTHQVHLAQKETTMAHLVHMRKNEVTTLSKICQS